MRLAILGDTHGDLAILAATVSAVAWHGVDAALQLGDLGFREDLLGAGRILPAFPIPVLAVCGNHEDHAFLARARRSGLARRWAERGLVYQPRGSVLRCDGCTLGFLGGALHADRPQERTGAGQPGNRISEDDIDGALLRFARQSPDIIVTHSCPAGLGVGMRGSADLALSVFRHVVQAGFETGPADDCGEPALTSLWQGLPRKPHLWCFGHFHRDHDAQVGPTRFLGRASLAPGQAVAVWDTRQRALSFLGSSSFVVGNGANVCGAEAPRSTSRP